MLAENCEIFWTHIYFTPVLRFPLGTVLRCSSSKKLEWQGYLTEKKSLTISLAVRIQYTSVADRQMTLAMASTVLMQCFVVTTRSSADADNRLDAFSGQSRSTNMVPFHMLHIVSYCAIVTLSLRRFVFKTFLRYSSSKNFMTLKWGSKVTQGHWEWYHSIDCVWFPISVL